jgi:hypothetical protein
MSLLGEFDGGIPVRPLKKNLNQMRKQFTALKDTPQPVLTMPMMTLRLVMIPMRILTGVAISMNTMSTKSSMSLRAHPPRMKTSLI